MNQVSSIYHENGLALKGYDPVSYFIDNKAIKGSQEFRFSWSGLDWHFTSQRHLDLFIESPERYVPAYGGYCAFGASYAYKAKPKMDAFYIHEGKLYLNFAKYVQKRWLETLKEKTASADQQWEETQKTNPIKANRKFIYIKYKVLLLFGKDLFA